MIVAFALSHATAATLRTEADDTLSITAFGEKLIVPRQFAADVYVNGRNAKTCVEDESTGPGLKPRPPTRLRNSLQRWLIDPKKAECFEQLAPTQAAGNNDVLTLVFVPDRNGLWPYPGLAGLDLRAYKIAFRNLAIRVGPVWPNDTETCVRSAEGGAIDSNGYLRNGLSDGTDVSFLRAAGPAATQMCVSCDKISVWTCSDTLTSTLELLAVTATWRQATGESSPAWVELDAALRRFAAQASPYRDKQDLP